MHPKILFLYTELAGYFLSCLKCLSSKSEIHVLHWPVNKEAPFQFVFPPGVSFYERSSLNYIELAALARQIQPDAIVCSGWLDKDYVNVAKSFRHKIPVIVSMDNAWKGSLRQHFAAIISPFTVSRYFSHAWVPDEIQAQFAVRLGFDESHILKGYYCADTDLFGGYYSANITSKKRAFPHRFIYTGRYIRHKGISEMWEAFIALQREQSNDWELWCAGTGELYDERREHPKIRHFGFVQPEELGKIISETGVFLLPSHFEPWGVVVHEFAAAGFPLLCSNKVGATEKFLEDGKNGFIFESRNIVELKNCLKKLIQMPDEQLLSMSVISVEKAKQITPDTWAETLFKIITS